MKTVYLAGPFFSPTQLKLIKQVEAALANNETVTSFFSPRQVDTSNQTPGSASWAQAIFDEDLKQLQAANLIVAVTDYPHDNPDSGTAFELGYAFAHTKPLILLHTADYPLNLMLTRAARACLTSVSAVEQYDFTHCPAKPYTGKNF